MKRVGGIKTPEERYEEGLDHDDRSVELVKALQRIDNTYNDGNMDIKLGGDGDIGEDLMYLLDVYFEELDRKK